MKHNVFVYGTLKRGKKNHHFLASSHFIAKAFLQGEYILCFDDHPCLVEADSTDIVHGELYEVDSQTLEKLDELEEHPTWYTRQERQVHPDGAPEGTAVTAWVYLFPKGLLKSFRPIEGGCFE